MLYQIIENEILNADVELSQGNRYLVKSEKSSTFALDFGKDIRHIVEELHADFTRQCYAKCL